MSKLRNLSIISKLLSGRRISLMSKSSLRIPISFLKEKPMTKYKLRSWIQATLPPETQESRQILKIKDLTTLKIQCLSSFQMGCLKKRLENPQLKERILVLPSWSSNFWLNCFWKQEWTKCGGCSLHFNWFNPSRFIQNLSLQFHKSGLSKSGPW